MANLDKVNQINSAIANSPTASQNFVAAPSVPVSLPQTPNPHDSPNYNPQTDPTSSAYKTSIPSTINSSNLSTPTVTVPTPTPPTTTASAVDAQAGTNIQQQQQGIYNILSQQQADAQSNLNSTKSSVLDYIKQKAGIATDKATAYSDPAFVAKQQATADANNALEQNKQAQIAEIDAVNKSNMTDAGRQASLRDITNRYALSNANLSVVLDAANRNFSVAQNTIDKISQLKTEAIQPYIDYYSSFLNANQSALTNAEKDIVNNRIDQYKTNIQNIGQVGDITKSLLSNGIILRQDQITKLNSFTNPKDAYDYLSQQGISIQDPVEKAIKQAQLAKLNAEITKAKADAQKALQDVEAGKPMTGEYGSVINTAGSLVGADKGKTSKVAIANALSSNDPTTAYALIGNNVEDSLTGTNKTRFSSARTDIGVMQGLRDAVKAYTDAGGDTGFLKGSADSIAKRFGQLETDPKFAALGTMLDREFQTYRNEMTGAVFSPAESADYAKVNPRTNATLDLNLATMDGALNQLTNRVTSTIETRVPGSTKIYKLITPTTNKVSSNPQDDLLLKQFGL